MACGIFGHYIAMTVSEAVVLTLPNDTTAPGLARQFIAEHSGELSRQVEADAELLVSELVTNAVRHGRPEITVRLCTDPPKVGVAVDDCGDAAIEGPTCPEPEQTSGRGLLIVDAVASAWGVTPHAPPPGKTVWFELS